MNEKDTDPRTIVYSTHLRVGDEIIGPITFVQIPTTKIELPKHNCMRNLINKLLRFCRSGRVS